MNDCLDGWKGEGGAGSLKEGVCQGFKEWWKH